MSEKEISLRKLKYKEVLSSFCLDVIILMKKFRKERKT